MDRNSVDWRGYIPAVTTPFDEHGELDLAALRSLLGWLLEEGMHGIILCGTQGEWFSLSREERRRVLALAGECLGGRMTLLAGCTGYTAAEALENMALAADCGFDGALITPPPYMVPTTAETLAYYADIDAAATLPICVYNWPPGTNVDLSRPLLEALAALEHVVAIKNSTADLGHFMDVFFALKDRVRVFGIPMNRLGASLVTEHGADGTMGAGAVLGRELPDYFNRLWAGDTAGAVAIGERNDELMQAWFHADYTGRFGAAQAIFKEALNQQGLPGGYPRRPVLPVDAQGARRIRETLQRLGRL